MKDKFGLLKSLSKSPRSAYVELWKFEKSKEKLILPHLARRDVIVNELLDDKHILSMLVENIVHQQKRMRVCAFPFQYNASIITQNVMQL